MYTIGICEEEPPLDILFLDIEFGGCTDGVIVGKELRSDLNGNITCTKKWKNVYICLKKSNK